MLGRTRRVHFVGIGGIGMSGIAELLARLGYAVSGSDEKASAATERLAATGVSVTVGHAASNVGDADVVVVSSAVGPGNPEVHEAADRRIPVIPRGEMLAELMRLREGIAVAGSHGKTTTTAMIALVLERAGLDPTVVIGGRFGAFGGNAKLGGGALLVAEADESDRSFLTLRPTMAVMTNIDHEHLDTYGAFGDLQQAFADFANSVPFYGVVVACADDAPVAAILPRVTRPVTTYGLGDGADVFAAGIACDGFRSRATVRRRRRRGGDETLGPLALRVPGRHNLQNAMAAVAVGLEIGVPFESMAETLAGFRGVARRFEVRDEPNGILVVDDYGHHPTEIAAVLDAAVALGRRIVVVFQPHRYTRTRALMEAFGPALVRAGHIVLTDIYAAGEAAIPGVTIDALAAAVRPSVSAPVEVAPSLDEAMAAAAAAARPGDVVITLGAGSIAGAVDGLIARLRRGEGGRP